MGKMKVGIVCDQFGNLQRGGAEVQVDNTVKYLNMTGDVVAEYIDRNSTDIDKYDLIHFFESNIEYYPLACTLKEKGIPYVVSTIVFPKRYWMAVCKYRFVSYLYSSIRRMFSASFRYGLWENAACLYPNTDQEALFLKRIIKNKKIEVVLNGIDIKEMNDSLLFDSLFFDKYEFLKGQKFVLNVARIDTRKNQKNLLLACKKLDLPLVLIGKIWDEKYYKEMIGVNYNKLYYLGPIYDRKLLFSAYKACSLFCLPSTLETPGIAALEAAYFNKPVVVTKYGGTQLYFKDFAYYIEWNDVNDIANGIRSMFEVKRDTRGYISGLSWENIARTYVESYRAICE